MSAFALAVTSLLREEGGYVADDPGGPTNFGISQKSYPALTIRDLTEQDAVAIYRRDFWLPLRCDELPVALAVGLLDAAVNQGPVPAVLDLQKALGVTADGRIGPQTLARAQAAEVVDTLTRFFGRRAMRYALTAHLSRYGLTWFTRCFRVYRRCLSAIGP